MTGPRGAMRVLRSRAFAATVAVVATIAGLWIAFRGVDLKAAAAAVRTFPVFPIVLAFVIMIAGTVLRGVRWHFMMRKQGSTLVAATEAVLISIFFNGVLPLRMGEVARVGYFAKRTGAPVASTAAVLVLERVLDVVSLAIIGAFFLSGAVGRRVPELKVPPSALGFAAVAAAAALIGAGLWLRKRRANRSSGKPSGKIARLVDDGMEGLTTLESGFDIGFVFAVSIVMWLLIVAPTYTMFRGLGFDITFSDAAVIMLGVVFAIALPSSPGFVGTFHAGLVVAAGLVGIPKEVALPVAIVFHLLTQIPFIGLGGLVLIYRGGRGAARGALDAGHEILDEESGD